MPSATHSDMGDLPTMQARDSKTADSDNLSPIQQGALQDPGVENASEDFPGQDVEATIKSRGKWHTTAILVSLLLSLFVAALDATIVATAASVITREFQSATGYVWIGAAYLLADAVTGPIWASISDIWGRKNVLLAALSLFFMSSIVCATAQTMEALIVGRALQGAGGGALILVVQISISDMFSMRRRSLFMGLCECAWALAGGLGPIIGGLFATLASWRWCFWMNLPVCAVAFILIILFFDLRHEHTPWVTGLKAIDWLGVLIFLGFALLVLLGLNIGSVSSWSSPTVIAMVTVGVGLGFAFAYYESKWARHPLIPVRIFKARSNIACCLVGFFHGMVLIGGEYFMPLFFQSVGQATPLQSGVLVLPLLLSAASGGIISGITINKTGRFRQLLWIGGILTTSGYGSFISFDMTTSLATLAGCQILGGIGAGILIEPPIIAIQTTVAQDDIAAAIASFSFTRSAALAISVIIGGVVFNDSMQRQRGELQAAGLPDDMLQRLSGKEAAANIHAASSSISPSQLLAVKGAFSRSLRNMFIMYTCLAFCAFLSGLFVRKARLQKAHVETVTGVKKEQGSSTSREP